MVPTLPERTPLLKVASTLDHPDSHQDTDTVESAIRFVGGSDRYLAGHVGPRGVFPPPRVCLDPGCGSSACSIGSSSRTGAEAHERFHPSESAPCPESQVHPPQGTIVTLPIIHEFCGLAFSDRTTAMPYNPTRRDVADEATGAYLTFDNGAYSRSLAETQPALVKIGAPFDSVLVDDLDRLDPSPYRFVIFFHTYHLSSAQRDLVRGTLLRPGVTALWFYASGLFDGHHASVDSMAALTGMHIAVGDPARPVAPRIEPTSRQESSGKEDSRNLKPFRWNPAGNQSRPVEPDQQPEASLAWWVGDHPCEA